MWPIVGMLTMVFFMLYNVEFLFKNTLIMSIIILVLKKVAKCIFFDEYMGFNMLLPLIIVLILNENFNLSIGDSIL